jgi:hypothetical protein
VQASGRVHRVSVWRHQLVAPVLSILLEYLVRGLLRNGARKKASLPWPRLPTYTSTARTPHSVELSGEMVPWCVGVAGKQDIGTVNTGMSRAYPFRRKQRIDCLLRQSHSVTFATEIGKFDPHDRIVFRIQNECSDLEDTLPHFNVGLTTL